MEPTLRLLSVVLIICGLILAGVGCSSTNAPSDHASGLVVLASEGTITGPTGPKEIEMLLAEVARLRLAAQESFAAASLIGTTEAQLAEARAALGRADQLIREGQTVAARDSQESRRQLQAAESALRQAEEAAVRAGLTRIEHELAEGYAQVLTPKFGSTLGAGTRDSQRSQFAGRGWYGFPGCRQGTRKGHSQPHGRSWELVPCPDQGWSGRMGIEGSGHTRARLVRKNLFLVETIKR
jgi:hypothetical protein